MRCILALGTFDGVHMGHRALLQKAALIAKEKGLRCVVYTFSNHPREVFSKAPLPLMSAEEKRSTLLSLGADEVAMVPFTKETASLSPEEFVQALLAQYDVETIVAGEDFTFGKNASGTVATLAQLGKQYGFSVCVAPFVTYQGEKVSSTRIRKALDAGDTALTNILLGK